MFVGLTLWGMRSNWFLMMWPSTPESRIVGIRGRAMVLVASLRSGGCGSGLHLGGDLTLTENPGNQFEWRSSACPQRSSHLGWEVERTRPPSRPRWREGGRHVGLRWLWSQLHRVW